MMTTETTLTVEARDAIVRNVDAAHGVDRESIARRVIAVGDAIAAGIKVSALSKDLRALAQTDSTVTGVSPAALGWASAVVETAAGADVPLAQLMEHNAGESVYRIAMRHRAKKVDVPAGIAAAAGKSVKARLNALGRWAEARHAESVAGKDKVEPDVEPDVEPESGDTEPESDGAPAETTSADTLDRMATIIAEQAMSVRQGRASGSTRDAAKLINAALELVDAVTEATGVEPRQRTLELIDA